jgi:hypothetical protein
MDVLTDGPARAKLRLVLAHGAGAPMDSPFMTAIARGLGEAGLRVARFEFPYMAARRQGRRPAPDRLAALVEAWHDAIEATGHARSLVIGGKSMGGRIASLIADEAGVAGLVCLGFPFHAAGKAAGERIAHLAKLRTRTLIVQGTRDVMGTRAEVRRYKLSSAIHVRWIEGGDHSLVPLKSSGATAESSWSAAVAAVAVFVRSLRVAA